MPRHEHKFMATSSNRPSAGNILLFTLLVIGGIGAIVYVYLNMVQRIEGLQAEVQTLQGELATLRAEQQALIDSLAAQKITRAEQVEFRGQLFDTYVVSLKEQDVKIFWQGADSLPLRNLQKLKAQIEGSGRPMLFGMNAGMYMPDNSPQGLYIENGNMHVPLDTGEGYGNFYLKPNGVFLIRNGTAEVVETRAFPRSDSSIQYATQSGPMLLIDGAIHPAFREGSTNLHIRNGVGMIAPDKIIFAISQKPVNFFDFASLFKEQFGCANALYLDGAISKMYLPELNRSDLTGNLGPLIGIVPY